MSETGNRGLNAREHWRTPRLIRFVVTIFFNMCHWILQRGDVIHAIYVETTKRNADELQKPTHQSFWFADLRIRVSTFRNCYANAADHLTKSDLKSKSKIAAVIMKWLSPGIPFIHYRQKIWNIFYLSHFLHFCGVCRVYLYLKYIPTSRYYFLGS